MYVQYGHTHRLHAVGRTEHTKAVGAVLALFIDLLKISSKFFLYQYKKVVPLNIPKYINFSLKAFTKTEHPPKGM